MRDRLADVTDGRCGESAGGKHLGSHFRGGGLAIGSGDADPTCRFAGGIGVHTQLPCQLHLAHHGDATALRLKDERRTWIEHRRGHHQIHVVPIDLVEGVQVGIGLLFIHADDLASPWLQYLHHASARNTQTRHDHGLTVHIHVNHPYPFSNMAHAVSTYAICHSLKTSQLSHRPERVTQSP